VADNNAIGPHNPLGLADITEFDLVPGRSCGTCTMCCKVYTIPELKKRAGDWCVHVMRGRGCGIYENRPALCQHFYCTWRLDATLGPEWKPDKSHFVVALDLTGYRALTLTLDPGMPLAWKKEPYYSVIKGWAEKFFQKNKKVLVLNRGFVTVVLPDRDVPLGVISPGEEILIYREGSTYGATLRRLVNFVEPPASPPVSDWQPSIAGGNPK
jgi:Fe-S-cluster containining protein